MPESVYDPKVYDHALDAAKDALGFTDTSRDRALGRRLSQTKVGDTFRPYAAAYRWLAANPKWVEQTTRLTLRGSPLSLPELAAEQAAEDARLNLDVPAYLSLEPEQPYSGPVRMAFRL
jgi:hypothetical protein